MSRMVTLAAVMTVSGRGGLLPSVSKCAPVSSRNTSSSVGVRRVRSRTRTDASCERDGDRTDRRRPVVDADGELVVAALDLEHAVDAVRARGSAASASPSMRATMTSVPIAALELGGRALGDEAAGVDDADAVGELVGLLEVLRGEEDGHPELVVEPPHLLPHAGAADRVEAGGRLVEEQHVGVVHQRGGEVEAAPHAARVGVDAAVERVAEVDELAELDEPLSISSLRAARRADPAGGAARCRSASGRARRPAARRRCAGAPASGRSAMSRPATSACPPRRREQRAEHLDGGRLAGAVGAEEAVDLASRGW